MRRGFITPNEGILSPVLGLKKTTPSFPYNEKTLPLPATF